MAGPDERTEPGGGPGDDRDAATPRLPHLERDEAPLYLARYYERQAQRAARAGDATKGSAPAPDGTARDRHPAGTEPAGAPTPADHDGTPLYLRRFRERRANPSITEPPPPLWQRSGAGMQRTLSEDNRNKEIVAPREARRDITNDIYLIRHGETQGYSTESGLTPLGGWQAHTWGHTLAKRVSDGEEVVVASAATNRAGQTASQLHKGLLDGLALFEKDVKVHDPRAMAEFRNFAVATPDGLRDVTAAFRRYYAVLEQFERTASGDRPTWLVEIDRFWRVQQGGGDPIQHWLTTPMLHFEPPALCVRRFWTGILALAADHPKARLAIATHSGPIRAFAVWALGYDPGEPYNTEHVRVKLMAGDGQALVSYRNRVQPVQIPDVAALPSWSLDGG